jgi:hypothetical protein
VLTPMTLIRLSYQEPTAQRTAQAPAAPAAQPAPSLPPTTLAAGASAEPDLRQRRDVRVLEDKAATLNRRAADLAYETHLEKSKQEGRLAAAGAKPEPTAEEVKALGYVRAPAPPPAPPPAEEIDRLGERESGTDAKKAQAPPPATTTTLPAATAASRPAARTAPGVAAATPRPARDGDLAFKRADELQTADEVYLDLEAQPSNTVEAARKAREAWRTYVAAQPEGPRADVARVRTIEAGMAAWELSREEPDREVVLRDIAQYLARRDSRQGERVRSLRQRLEPR